tara:strand:- start:1091 stop:1447 length:357 start_codon:yes stop_codon:yes gene_type:complete
MGVAKKWASADRDRVISLRKSGTSWPKISKVTGIPRGTCRSIWKATKPAEEEAEPAKPAQDEIEEAFVLKHVPNPRLMLIGFPGRDGFARCVKKPEDNRPVKCKLLVKRVEDDLYRLV